MKKNSLQSILTFLIGWPLSILALYFIFTRVFTERDDLFANLHTLSIPPLLIGLVFFLLYYYLRGAVWYVLLRSFHYKLSYKESTSLWSVTQLKRYIPGNIWSFLGLTILLNKKGIEKKHTLQAILFEQELVIVAGLAVSLLGLPYFLTHFMTDLPAIVRPLIILGVLILCGGFIFNRTLLSYFKFGFLKHLEHISPGFSPKRLAELVLLMALSFFVLGVGYYFTLLSVTYLTPELFLQVIGISVFSLLIGFVSFITPTGLGIREGAFAFIIAKVIPFATGGFVALLARILLIAVELLFVLVTALWNKMKTTSLEQHEAFFIGKRHIVLVLLATFLYIAYFTYAGFLRYDNFYTGRFDLGNMAQTVWNTTQGNIFTFTDPNGTREVSRLAFHADFILILFSPLYMLWQNPKVLILIQAVIVGLGSIFVYLLAKDILKNKNLAVILSMVYLLNPAIQWTLLYDFHAVVLATTFLLGCWYFLIRKNYVLFVIFAVLAGITKEQVWFVIALFGLYIAVIQKKYQIGALVALVAAGLFYTLIWQFIPGVSGSDSHFAVGYYQDGDSPGELIRNTLFHPVDTFVKITEPGRLLYVRQLLEPLGYISLLAPLYLVFAAADIGINLISDKPQLHQIYYQYSAVISPFLFIAAMYGIKILKNRVPKLSYGLIGVYLLIMTISSAFRFGPLPGSDAQNIGMFTRPQPAREEIARVLSEIPTEQSVSATNNLGPQLSHRRQIFVTPHATDSADFVAFLFTERSFTESNRDVAIYRAVRENPNYKLRAEKELFFLFERR